MSVTIYTAKNPTWVNAAGDNVPYKFVPQIDRKREAQAAKIHAAALKVEASLQELYALMNMACKEVHELIKKEYALKSGKEKKEGKGSLTWFNFDKSIKIEADVNDIVKWDSALMTEALAQLNSYLAGTLTDAQLLIKGMVTEGFSNSRGMIDSRKIFQLLKYDAKIKNQHFQKACELIKQAQSIDTTKLYMRIWEKEEDGSYRSINLNFSTL